jgi:hypothetical protein
MQFYYKAITLAEQSWYGPYYVTVITGAVTKHLDPHTVPQLHRKHLCFFFVIYIFISIQAPLLSEARTSLMFLIGLLP